MSLTNAQASQLLAAIRAEPSLAAPLAAGNTQLLAEWCNGASTFVVRKNRVASGDIGPILNYVAVSNLTTANRDRATTFLLLNPNGFRPTADVESYWDTTFGGALGGEGANTRAALQALWRRNATRAERVFATGTGTFADPGVLVWEGQINFQQITGWLEQGL